MQKPYLLASQRVLQHLQSSLDQVQLINHADPLIALSLLALELKALKYLLKFEQLFEQDLSLHKYHLSSTHHHLNLFFLNIHLIL